MTIKPTNADFKDSQLTPGIHAPFNGPDPDALRPQKPKKYGKTIISNLAKFIEYNPNLQHLDLSEMHLGDKILDLIDAIRKSQNLISIHLGHNSISQGSLRSLFVHLAIDMHQFGQTLKNQSNVSQLDDGSAHGDKISAKPKAVSQKAPKNENCRVTKLIEQ